MQTQKIVLLASTAAGAALVGSWSKRQSDRHGDGPVETVLSTVWLGALGAYAGAMLGQLSYKAATGTLDK